MDHEVDDWPRLILDSAWLPSLPEALRLASDEQVAELQICNQQQTARFLVYRSCCRSLLAFPTLEDPFLEKAPIQFRGTRTTSIIIETYSTLLISAFAPRRGVGLGLHEPQCMRFPLLASSSAEPSFVLISLF